MYPSRRAPTRPGTILEEEFLKPQHIDAKKFADALGSGWNELRVNAIITGTEGISDLAAHEFADALGTTVEFWNRLTQHYQQWERIQKHNEKGAIKPWKKAQ